MTTERTKSKIGRWVDETMKGKFDNFVGSRKKSSTNTSTKINNEVPILPDVDEHVDADFLHSVRPAELHSKMTESVYEDESSTRPSICLTDIDLGILFSNLAQKQHLEDISINQVNTRDKRDFGKMIQEHLKLLNISSEKADEDVLYRSHSS